MPLSKIRKSIREWRDNSKVFYFYLKKYRKYYAIGLTSLIIVDGLESVPPLLLMYVINALTENKSGAELKSLLINISLIYMAVACVQGAMRFLWRKYIIRTSMLASHDMRDELFRHLAEMNTGFFKKRRVGELVSLSTNDIEAVRFALGPGALVLFDALFYFITIPPIMFWISPQLTLLAFIPLIIVPFFVRRMENRIQKEFREVQDRFSQLAAHCQEAVGGIRVVKGSALEPFKEREFSQFGERYRDANLKSAKVQSTLSVGLETILSVSTSLLFLVGGSYVIGGKITIGVFVAFQKYINKMSWPMEAFGMAANIFQRSIASQKRVEEILNERPSIQDPANSRPIPSSQPIPLVEVKNLTFHYPGVERAALRNFSFRFEPGMKVGIAGGVGSGKSTLLACIARMEAIEPGKIFFNEKDVTELSLSEVRSRISFVPQESFLFSKNVEENILYGSPVFNSTDKSMRLKAAQEAVALASVTKDIDRLPEKYETMLGERGVNISGGQRQRLTIARALARKPQMLILDDCMSAIDAETERNLIRGLMSASSGISLLIASHRITSFEQLDWVIFLEDGAISAQGHPSDLLKNHKNYLDLARKQELEGMNLLK